MEALKNEFVACEITLSYRPKIKASQRPKITSSKAAYNLLVNAWNPDKLEFLEEFKIIILNRGNRMLGIVDISSGGISGTLADSKVIFGATVTAAGSSIIMAHNHPSGSLNPSATDLTLTKKMKEAGLLLDIAVLDHLIITAEGYYSFADEGLL